MSEQPVDVGLLGSIDHERKARDPVARIGANEVLLAVDRTQERSVSLEELQGDVGHVGTVATRLGGIEEDADLAC